MDLAEMVYRLVDSFPKHELYGLSQQLRRAAVSVPSNIAEGHGRRTSLQRFSFLENALGSAFEIETQLELAKRLGYLSPADYDEVLGLARMVRRGLIGLMKFVKSEAPKDRGRFSES